MKNENLLLLHFGLPKTGTTSLQSFLKLNKKKLHELGWCYPDLNKEYYLHEEYPEQEKNGYLLDFFYMNSWENESRELWAIIKRKLKTSNVNISEESFWGGDEECVFKKLQSFKKQYSNIKVILYLRRQDLALESLWCSLVDLRMYDKDILECYEETKDRYFAYLKKIKAIEKAIGRSNLIIRVYEKNQFEGTRNDVISDFLHVLGKMYSPLLQGNDWEYPERQNVKLSDYALSYALEYNREFNKYSRNKSLQPEIQMSNRELSRLTDDGGRGRYLNLIQRKNLLDSYANENETIAREYLNREDGKLFYNDCVEYTLWKKQEFTELDRKIISIMAKQAAEYSNRILLLREKNNKRGVIRELKRKYIKHKDIMRRRLWTIFPI